ncbi:MAG: hypothetical protein FGM38_06720 [Solirubrobacterales bacterium]|nr:hypothetical protein [Solirubrobacterales bacterium]
MPEREAIVERERRWLLPAGIASVAGVALVLATFGESAAAVRTTAGLAEKLRDIDADPTPLVLASVVQAIGWLLLAVPLVFLFKAAAARASRVRSGLLGVVIVAPIFLAAGSLLGAIAVTEAAGKFTEDGPAAIQRCLDRQAEKEGTAPDDPRATCEEQAARDERTSTSVAGIETGFGLAGLLGFTIAVVYTALWGLRTGLLSRFWGSLGIALGVVFSFFTLFTLAWFIYLGLLLAGWVPGGRPPAWGSGEARPWPKGGPLFGGGANRDGDDSGDGVIEGEAEEVEVEEVVETGELTEGPGDSDRGEAPRKRKKRDS